MSVTNGIVSFKVYDKRDDFNFEILNFPFLHLDVPHSPSCGIHISQRICLAEYVLMLVTSTEETNFLLLSY